MFLINILLVSIGGNVYLEYRDYWLSKLTTTDKYWFKK